MVVTIFSFLSVSSVVLASAMCIPEKGTAMLITPSRIASAPVIHFFILIPAFFCLSILLRYLIFRLFCPDMYSLCFFFVIFQSSAFFTDSIKNRSARIHAKSMTVHQVLFQFNHILAVKMYQFSTFFAFAVETGHLVALLVPSTLYFATSPCSTIFSRLR